MLKGGVIMDVVNAEQAKIAEDAGAAAVMALERVPADIRRDGGVARMSPVSKIREIQRAVTIPVMAKCRIGHTAEARILEALKVDFIDESEVLTPADEENHVYKHDFKIPFVCGCRNLGEALRRIGEGAAMIRTKGEAGTGDVVHAVKHLREVWRDIRNLTLMSRDERMSEAKRLAAPYELVVQVAETGKLPVAEFRRRRDRDARRRRALHVARRRGGLRRVRDLQVRRPGQPGPRDRQGDDALARRAGPGRGRGVAGLRDEGNRRREPARRGPAPDEGLVMSRRQRIAFSPVRSPRFPVKRADWESGEAGRRGEGNGTGVAVLALQGDFEAHRKLAAMGIESFEARRPGEIEDAAGLVIPGGESTTLWKFFESAPWEEAIARLAASGGRCSGRAPARSCWRAK